MPDEVAFSAAAERHVMNNSELRDHFASMAIAGIARDRTRIGGTDNPSHGNNTLEIAASAYAVADAMMAIREATSGGTVTIRAAVKGLMAKTGSRG
jgi:hypothetical protein